jgi:ketosteroid isomerase-like protein
MRIGLTLLAVLTLALAGCGGGSDDADTAATGTTSHTTTHPDTEAAGEAPPAPAEPNEETEHEGLGPAVTEASPEGEAQGPAASGELSDEDNAAVAAVVRDYVTALNRHDAARVCRLLLPGALDLSLLPKRRGGCRPSLRASIGTPPRRGGPAWRKTTVVEVKAEDLGGGRARVSATVTSRFSDRKYVSVEDDVVYLERVGPGWQLAKPSGTLYRAVGYPEPPLSSLTPPPGWA